MTRLCVEYFSGILAFELPQDDSEIGTAIDFEDYTAIAISVITDFGRLGKDGYFRSEFTANLVE